MIIYTCGTVLAGMYRTTNMRECIPLISSSMITEQELVKLRPSDVSYPFDSPTYSVYDNPIQDVTPIYKLADTTPGWAKVSGDQVFQNTPSSWMMIIFLCILSLAIIIFIYKHYTTRKKEKMLLEGYIDNIIDRERQFIDPKVEEEKRILCIKEADERESLRKERVKFEREESAKQQEIVFHKIDKKREYERIERVKQEKRELVECARIRQCEREKEREGERREKEREREREKERERERERKERDELDVWWLYGGYKMLNGGDPHTPVPSHCSQYLDDKINSEREKVKREIERERKGRVEKNVSKITSKK